MKKIITTALATMVGFYGYSQDGVHLPLTGGTLTGSLAGTVINATSWMGSHRPLYLYSNNHFLTGRDVANSTYYELIGVSHNNKIKIDNQAIGTVFGGSLTGASATFNTDNLSALGGQVSIVNSHGNQNGEVRLNLSNASATSWIKGLVTGVNTNGGSAMVFGVPSSNADGIERMRIDANGNIGIGTTTPTATLELVRGNGSGGTAVFRGTERYTHINYSTEEDTYIRGGKFNSNIYLNDNGGNVGIGTISPNALLSFGALIPGSNVINRRLQLNSNWVPTNGIQQLTALSFVATSGINQNPFLDTDGETYKNWHLASVSDVGYYGSPRFSFIHRGSEYFTVKDDGNIGIGTTTPDSKLTVAGKIHAREVKVALEAGGADFVFEKDYNLKPLTEVAEYISINKHLPEIASADEMKKNGLELGLMNIKLLQKIEELTLHLIEMNKRVQELEKQLKK